MPQVEDGYTRLANELFDVILAANLTEHQRLVLLVIIRKTYGYNKKCDDISASQISDVCGIARPHVTKALNELAEMNVITKQKGSYGSVLGVQKDYTQWQLPERKKQAKAACTESVHPVQNLYPACTESVQVASTKSVHTKDNLPKDNQQKTTRKSSVGKVTLDVWLAKKKEAGEKPIPENHAVFAYADKIGLPIEYVRLCWLKFKDRYSGKPKQYSDWSLTFLNCVKDNYYHLWFDKGGAWELTTAGIQVQKEMQDKA